MSRNDLPGPNAANFAQRLREAVMTYLGRQGDPLDRGITLRDLVEGGVVRLRSGWSAAQAVIGGGALPIEPEPQTEEPDLTPPPTPTGFAVSAAISHVFIEHDSPSYTVGHGHLRTRVYGKTVADGDPLPTFADASEITQFTGRIHAHPSNPATTWRLWIKWETQDGVLSVSPAGGTNGLEAKTGQDVATLLTALTGKIRQSELLAGLGARIDLIDGAASLPGSVNERISDSQSAVTALVTVPAYSAGKTYTRGELATYNGNLYKATAPTQGNPPTDTSKWKLIGAYSSLANSFSAAFTDYLTTAETTSAISSATTGLVSTTSLNNTLGSYVTTSTLTNDYYTKTAADEAISTATTGLVSTTSLNNTLGSYVTTSTLTNDYYTKTAADEAISTASQTLVARYGELDAAVSWNFAGGADGFTALGATLSSQGQYVRLSATGTDPILVSPAISVSGATHSLIRARVRRVAGTGWQGDVYYTTGGHGASESFRKNIADTTALNQWRLLEWDMADLTAGGQDWTASTILAIRLDLGSTAADVFDIDWIAVGRLGVGAYSSAIQALATTTAGPDGATAQYTVKIDQGGHVTGFGLSSTANNAAPLSEFGVRADRFWIAPPTFVSSTAPTTGLYKGYVWRDTGVNPAVTRYWSGTAWTTTPQNLPFVVLPGGGSINGQTVPAGVYIDTALIADATITNAKIANAAIDDAKIANLSADKVNAGFLNVDRLQAGSVTAAKIDSRDLTIKNSQGQIIFSASGVVGGGNLANNSDFLVQAFPGGPPLHFANYNNAQVSVTNQLLAGGPIANSYYWRITINAGGSSTMGFYFNSAASCFGGFKPNTNYIVSFYARCNAYAGAAFQDAWNLAPPFPGGRVALQNPGLSSEWRRYVWLINFGNNTIDPNGFFTISQSNLAPGTVLDFACVQVEQGDAPSGWRPVGVSSLNPITGTNASTYIASAAIKLAQIDTATIDSLSSITANIGTLTAGVVRNTANTFRVDVDNGRTIARTGTYMKVTGIPFGSASQFIEWFGPYFANLSSCTEANAVYYLKTNGSAYFGGTLSAGILTNRGATSDLGSTAEIIVGPFGTNGNTKTVTLSYNHGGTWIEYQGSSTGTASGSTSATVKLYRKIGAGSESEVATLNVSGSWSYETDAEAQPGGVYQRNWSQSMSGSLTYTDSVSGTDNRTYRAQITARSIGFTTGALSQRVEIISVEQ